MTTTISAKKGKKRADRGPVVESSKLVIQDGLDEPIVFSVLRAAGGGDQVFELAAGKVPGAVAYFAALPDSEAIDLAGDAQSAAARFLGVPWSEVDVPWEEYPGGQALHAAGRIGAVLKFADLCGKPWPTAGCLSTLLGYPQWLCQAALDEYERQVRGELDS